MAKARSYETLFVVLLGAVSGVLLALALPPRGMAWLGWTAFLPLLIASRLARRSLISAPAGLISAAACGLVLSGGVVTSSQVGNQIGAFGGLGLVLASTAGFSSFACRRMSPGRWAILVPCAAVAAELLSQFVFPVNAAISQHQSRAALFAASYTGIWGVSFILWLVPASMIALLGKSRAVWPAVASAALVALAVLMSHTAGGPSGETVTIAAVQAQDTWSAAQTTNSLAHKAVAVVWPEFVSEPNDRSAYDAARSDRVYVVASYHERVRGARPYNSAHLISPGGHKIGHFRKRHPFGRESLIYGRGEVAEPVRCRGFTAGVAICFDTEFTDVTRGLVRRGADVILVPNSDPESPNHLFNHLHSAVIPFRAAENGVPIAWSEHTYGSMVVDSNGRIVSRAQSGSHPSSAIAFVHKRDGHTLCTRIGDCFAYLCAGAAALMLTLSTRRHLK